MDFEAKFPREDEVVETTTAMYENCSKPAALPVQDDEIHRWMMTVVADRVGGWSRLADKPVLIEPMGPSSALRLLDELCARLINRARWRTPVVCCPATFPGTSSSISMAGAVAQSFAELIAGTVVHQLAEPAAPELSGPAVLSTDLRQASLPARFLIDIDQYISRKPAPYS